MNTIKKIEDKIVNYEKFSIIDRLKRMLKLEKKVVILFLILLLIAFAGYTQSWVFGGKESGVAKPFLFEMLKPFPFWSLWMILLLPLTMIQEFLTLINIKIDLMSQSSGWLLIIINVLYFYFLSRLMILLYDHFLRKRTNNRDKKASGDQ